MFSQTSVEKLCVKQWLPQGSTVRPQLIIERRYFGLSVEKSLKGMAMGPKLPQHQNFVPYSTNLARVNAILKHPSLEIVQYMTFFQNDNTVASELNNIQEETLPEVCLPGNGVSISDSAEALASAY